MKRLGTNKGKTKRLFHSYKPFEVNSPFEVDVVTPPPPPRRSLYINIINNYRLIKIYIYLLLRSNLVHCSCPCVRVVKESKLLSKYKLHLVL